MHIEMGDDGRYNATDIGIVTFQREFGSPLTLKYVKYVLSLQKNLVSVSLLEDHGYDVIFRKGKDFLRHIASREVKQIRVRVKNLYKLDIEDCVALSTKAEKGQSQEIGDLWHKILGFLHHGALKIVQQISIGLLKGTLEQRNTCKGCTLGNLTNLVTFHDKENRAQEILERVHLDVCGPFSTASTTKHMYYVIFVDEFSCKCQIFFMQKKDQMFAKFS